MNAAMTSATARQQPLGASTLRRHAALARALLEELDRTVPSSGADFRTDALDEQLVEELTRLGCRILECAVMMTRAPRARARFDSKGSAA